MNACRTMSFISLGFALLCADEQSHEVMAKNRNRPAPNDSREAYKVRTGGPHKGKEAPAM